MRKLGRALNIVRGQYRPPHTRPVDIGDVPVAAGFSREHLLGVEEDAPFGQLSFPASVLARELDLPPDDLVLAAERDGEARIWPVLLLRRYHVVNDALGGAPFTVTFCPRCFSGVAFDPVVDGTPLTFEVFGVYQGTMVMKDSQTDTVWTPFDGRAVAGRLLGRELKIEPFQMITLGRAIELHPDATTPSAATVPKPGARGPGEERQDGRLRYVVRTWDDRLPPRTMVLGVDLPGHARAYALDPDRPGPRVAQDVVGDAPIVLLAPAGGWPLAYDRRLDGEVLEFRLDSDRVVDGGGSTWQDGKAIAGPLAGRALLFVPSHLTEWYMWATYHVGSEIGRT